MIQLKEIRKKKGLTQTDLARIAGVSVQYIALIEQGGTSGVSEPIKEKLAKALEADVIEVFPDMNRKVNLYKLFHNFIGSFITIEKEDEPFLKKLVSSINEEEDLPDFFHSGMYVEELIREIRSKARKYGIEIPRKFSKK